MTPNQTSQRSVTINLENGLHLVPCSMIAQLARQAKCEIRLCKGSQVVDAKNIFDILTLSAEKGQTLEIQAQGEEAVDFVARLGALFDSDFATNASGES